MHFDHVDHGVYSPTPRIPPRSSLPPYSDNFVSFYFLSFKRTNQTNQTKQKP